MTRAMRQRLYGLAAIVTGGAWLWLEPLSDFTGREESRHGLGLGLACFFLTLRWDRERKAGREAQPVGGGTA